MQADDVFFLLFLGYLAGVVTMVTWARAVIRQHERAEIDRLLEERFWKRFQ